MSWPTVNKYRNIRVEMDGIKFQSKREAKRYGELKMLQKAGLITNLTLQKKFDLIVQDVKIGAYISDFAYLENGHLVIEDAKGLKLPVYNLKKRLMKAIYGIEIKEV